MSSQIKIAAVACALAFTGLAQAVGTWETTLLGRDINGNPVDGSSASAVFLYDMDLNITWLRDAFSGAGYWIKAKTDVETLVVGAYSGWRLPLSDSCEGYNCTGSEMGHLWYAELGNVAGEPMANTGDFQNLFGSPHWSGTDYAPSPSFGAMNFYTGTGSQSYADKGLYARAMAVRPGDVFAVPEPETYALMLAGLGVVGFAARRCRGSAT